MPSTEPKATSTSAPPRFDTRHLAIDEPTEEDRERVLKDFFGKLNTAAEERRAAVAAAQPALARLVNVMRQTTNQSGHVRGLLYSLFNGLPYSLLEIVSLDWAVQKDVAAVILAFGFEESEIVDGKRVTTTAFFYDAIKTAVTGAGLWAWFIEAESEVLA